MTSVLITNRMKIRICITINLFGVLLLSGCGGGGNSGASSTPVTPVVQACANGASNYPDCNFVPAQLQTTVPTPPYAAGSEDLAAFVYFNDLRADLGLGKLNFSTELEKSAINHVNYLKINQAGDFTEDPSKPGFTGESTNARAVATGYTTTTYQANVSGGIALGNTKIGAIKNLVDSVYHRNELFKQYWTDTGSGWICIDPTAAICNKGANGEVLPDFLNILVAFRNNVKQRNASDFVMNYPMDKSTDVRISFVGETINPFPQYTDGLLWGKVGYPVSIAVEDSQTLAVQTFTVTEDGTSTPMIATLFTAQSDPNHRLAQNEAYLVTNTAMKTLTKYNVTFVGTSTMAGSKTVRSVTKTWSFTTGRLKNPCDPAFNPSCS